MKMLLVDDSSTIRRVLKNILQRMFEQEEVEYFEAENGQIALDILRKNPDMDLVFLDFNMPIMSGDKFLDAVRADEEIKNVKVIMCTTEGQKSTVVSILKKGVSGYVIKPFTPDTVRKTIFPLMSRLGFKIS